MTIPTDTLQKLLSDCNKPGEGDALIIQKIMASQIVSELLYLRNSVSNDKQEIVYLVRQATFEQTVMNISSIIEDFGTENECDHVKAIANFIKDVESSFPKGQANERH